MTDQSTELETGQADQAPQEQETKPLFSIGDRQYDEESAVTKIKSADAFIDTLKSEGAAKDQKIADLEAKLNQATKLDDVLNKMKSKETPMTDQTTTDSHQAVDIEALKAELLKQAQEAATNSVHSYKQQEMSTANQTESINAAKARYGSEYESKLRELGSSFGLNDEAIDSMAKSNPALFKQTFGLNAKATSGIYPDGSQSSAHNLKRPELKNVSKHWSSSDKINAQLSNEAAIAKLIKESGGDYHAVAQALGVKVKNFAN